MECITKKIKTIFQNSIQKCFPSISEDAIVTYANLKFGHYQCNNAINIYKKYGKELNYENAQKISEFIISNINETIFEEIKSSPQGFITVKLSKDYIETSLKKLFNGEKIDISININDIKESNENYGNVLVDFSSPNIAKEMHVGHLRSTIIGDSICRVFEFLKINTHRVNHVGDWGTQFGMIINYIKTHYPNFKEEMPDLSNLTSLYQESKKMYDADKEFEKSSKENAIKLQNNDEDCKFVWNKLCESSKKEFDKLYNILDIKLEYVGESFYVPMLSTVLDLLKESKLLTNIGDAICYQSENFKVPLFLQKSNGGYGYDSTDVAALYYRLTQLNCNCVIYVTDIGQLTHFETIFDLIKKTNWGDKNAKLMHVGFDVDIDQLSESLCVSAIKYFDLKQHRNSDYKFSYDNMLNVKGNTGIYIIYGYSRICSIFRKSTINVEDISKDELSLTSIYEINLGLHILKFPDIFYYILKNMLVHKLAEYMYDLTTTFTAFYENCKVLNNENEKSRLLLCSITKSLLKVGNF
ncbi:hypothetical protein PFHG_04399 [Plasmodium falciparum HB3]|uniref:arginine--tRNA ligase n=1 Tax=Plasmodium falciparum (isolate HB3) TaxID=137071 RepID=A0A0L7KHU2_PLAFX|nr:hypothetical protein PFHG_04399 [Plasmodium falciparum HB3]